MSNRDLKKITNDTFKILRKYDSVPPELYRDTFIDLAKAAEIDLTVIDGFKEGQKVLGESAVNLEKLQYESNESVKALKSSTQQASEAIEKKDNKLLEKAQNDIENLSKKIAHLEASVFKDELTSVYNRRWLFDQFLALDAFKTKGTIGFLDLNNFKEINDTHGHPVGDKVLILVAHLISQLNNMSRDVFICRFGGDEFLILAPEVNIKVVQSELNAIKSKIESKVVSIKECSFKVGFSFGCCDFKEGDNFHQILEKVDVLMYSAKDLDKDGAKGLDKDSVKSIEN